MPRLNRRMPWCWWLLSSWWPIASALVGFWPAVGLLGSVALGYVQNGKSLVAHSGFWRTFGCRGKTPSGVVRVIEVWVVLEGSGDGSGSSKGNKSNKT